MIRKYWPGNIRNFLTAFTTNFSGPLVGSFEILNYPGFGALSYGPTVLTPTMLSAAVAAGAYSNVYTVTAGKKPHILRITISATVSARYSLEYNGVVLWTHHLPNSIPQIIEWGVKGLFINTAAALFRVQNNGAGAADIATSIALNEL